VQVILFLLFIAHRVGLLGLKNDKGRRFILIFGYSNKIDVVERYEIAFHRFPVSGGEPGSRVDSVLG
jgi:hypothetical protein